MPSVDEDELRRAAFGRLTSPTDADDVALLRTGPNWFAAVVLGARGRYAAAASAFGVLARGKDPVIAAAALTALASHRRQLGGHAVARRLDGRAFSLLTAGSGGDPDGVDAAGIRADALLGLAADNLALGGQRAARRLIAAVTDTRWRAAVRTGWVSAEVELAAGRADEAVAPARRAHEIAADRGADRHRVKSALVLSAALAATGGASARNRAAELVDSALGDVEKFGLRSLAWPACLLAADLVPANAERYRSRALEVLHAVLLRSDPEGRRIALRSPWVPK
ncbi:hypothetical protein [Amycolatopsis sp. CA-230715]|uniref:hypothetical protein n=1 Tax=Amycolatopsis sp. CA-230715 TaxID=2745196 RepID=UPI001C03690F|nr:hypothetical protein [Amycolatopsis sp. CA-230715]QWF79583.1 hypothetical protein HUW46_02992 [Amycolatopsis sp. CA-230715]